MISGTTRRSGPDDTFIQELSRLKRRGASVLVVGSVRANQRAKSCRQLLGHAAERSRRQVLVSTTGEAPEISNGLGEQPSDRFRMLNHKTHTRSVAAAEPASTSLPSQTPTETDTLVDLGVAISQTVETFEAEAGGLEPAELRIGIDSLLPLVEEYGKERMFRFVHLTNGRAKDVNGMIHYHLPVERDATIVSVFSPLFDVVVELRERNGVCQERWSLKGETLCSGWISTDQA